MTKITQLPQDTSPTTDDLTITVDSTSGQAKKLLLSDLIVLIGNTLSTTYATKRTTIFNEQNASSYTNATSTMSDVTGWTGGSITTTGGDVIFSIDLSGYHQTSGNVNNYRLVVGSSNYPSATGWSIYFNELNSHKNHSRHVLVTGLSAGTHAVKIQSSATSGTSATDGNDILRITAVEYLH